MTQPSNSKSHNLSLSPWALTLVVLYTTTAYFLGREISIIASIILMSVVFFIAIIANQKLNAEGLLPKAALVSLPILLVAAVLMRNHKQDVPLNLNYLSGMWTAQNNKEEFTIRINDGIALLSVEPGLKNVRYLARLRHDSLSLSADSSNILLLQVVQVDNEIRLNAGGGLLFTKAKKE